MNIKFHDLAYSDYDKQYAKEQSCYKIILDCRDEVAGFMKNLDL